jgi:DNA (cytosine-5)-methyltransferase 1
MDEPQKPSFATQADTLRAVLARAYAKAEQLAASDGATPLSGIDESLADLVERLAAINHAGRGVALTLLACKAAMPHQDIRAHKEEIEGGFSARTFDTRVTVPFLLERDLPRSVESHWLTQTFSFAGRLDEGLRLRTTPKAVGPLVIQIVNAIESAGSAAVAEAAVVALFRRLIQIRSQGRVQLTVPKNLSIAAVVDLLKAHFARYYRKNAPRLPQCAVYAVYRCLSREVTKYRALDLQPLGRMKSADRKAGTVGDIELYCDGVPFEAVEIKLAIPIGISHVREACEKVKSLATRRYYLLSTAGVSQADREAIEAAKSAFHRSNGCEVIVNGVLETISYYLRLLGATESFLDAYVTLLNEDPDVTYEHKSAWNEVCQARQ